MVNHRRNTTVVVYLPNVSYAGGKSPSSGSGNLPGGGCGRRIVDRNPVDDGGRLGVGRSSFLGNMAKGRSGSEFEADFFCSSSPNAIGCRRCEESMLPLLLVVTVATADEVRLWDIDGLFRRNVRSLLCGWWLRE